MLDVFKEHYLLLSIILKMDSNSRIGENISHQSSSNHQLMSSLNSVWGPSSQNQNLDKDRSRRTSRLHMSQVTKAPSKKSKSKISPKK